MDPWLKLMQALQGGAMGPGGTPYFNPRTNPGPGTNVPVASGTTPMRGAIPDATRGVYAQDRFPAPALPTAPPANQVPKSPPTMTEGNVPDAVSANKQLFGQTLNPGRFTGVGTTQYDPSKVQELAKAAIDNAKTPTERERLEQEYFRIASAPPEKQSKWMEALFMGLQATQRIADPLNQAGTYQQGQQIQSFAEAKKQDALGKIASRLNPIYAQQKQKYDSTLAGIKAEGELADLEYKQEQTRALKRGKTINKEVDGKTYYSDDGGKTWKDSQGIPAPSRVKVKLDSGPEVEVPATTAYTQQESNRRAKMQADATRESKEVDRAIAQGKMSAEQGGAYQEALRKWETDRDQMISEGQEKQNLASVKEGQAADMAAQGGAAEAAELRKEAAELRAAGRALIRKADALRKPKQSEFQTYNLPASATRDTVMQRLRQRGIKEGSAEWNKVLSAIP
jgi:hypothetical protein